MGTLNVLFLSFTVHMLTTHPQLSYIETRLSPIRNITYLQYSLSTSLFDSLSIIILHNSLCDPTNSQLLQLEILSLSVIAVSCDSTLLHFLHLVLTGPVLHNVPRSLFHLFLHSHNILAGAIPLHLTVYLIYLLYLSYILLWFLTDPSPALSWCTSHDMYYEIIFHMSL